MKTVIYYFTGTGNNLAVANQLSQELGNTDIFPVRVLLDHKVIPRAYEWVVFSVPSYYSHIPPFVEHCMEDLSFMPHQQIVTIIGCGGNRGHATEDMRLLIEGAGKKVRLEYMLWMPGNYILSYGAFPDWYNHLTTQHSYKKIKRIAKDMASNKKSIQLKKGLFYNEKYEESFQNTRSKYGEIGSQYQVSAACIQCGRCLQICPVRNITLQEGKIVFGEGCQQCMGCIQWCPKQAIDYQNKAKERKHYHHKDINPSDYSTES